MGLKRPGRRSLWGHVTYAINQQLAVRAKEVASVQKGRWREDAEAVRQQFPGTMQNIEEYWGEVVEEEVHVDARALPERSGGPISALWRSGLRERRASGWAGGGLHRRIPDGTGLPKTQQ